MGFEVTILEKNGKIFDEISGSFGIRNHVGLHYPRSESTQKACLEGLIYLHETYPDLIVSHEYSIYGVGTYDSHGKPSKVSPKEFKQVFEKLKCWLKNNGHEEFLEKWNEIDPQEYGYENLLYAVDVYEPSMAVGELLREKFHAWLTEAGVNILCNNKVIKVEKCDQNIKVTISNGEIQIADHVINATGFQSLQPRDPLPANMEIFYQPCLALIYQDKQPTSDKPISFITMDGSFPCLMPIYDKKEFSHEYVLTHAQWTLMGSYPTLTEANKYLKTIDEQFINNVVRPHCEDEMKRFYPEFLKRFKYSGCRAGKTVVVLPKLRTEKEFRNAVTFQDKKSGMIFVFPGKINNLKHVTDETLALMGVTNDNQENIISYGSYRFVQDGILNNCQLEIRQKPKKNDKRNTANVQTYQLSKVKAENTILPPTSPNFQSI
ncbi:1672_t:CDS:1, partial [Racocetra fulgida]